MSNPTTPAVPDLSPELKDAIRYFRAIPRDPNVKVELPPPDPKLIAAIRVFRASVKGEPLSPELIAAMRLLRSAHS